MTTEVLIAIIGTGGTLLGVIVGAFISHFLETSRNKHSLILNKKIEIYSNILVKISTMFQDEKINLALNPVSLAEMRAKIAKTLSEGRLIAGKKLESKLREYHEEATLFWRDGKSDNKMSNLAIEIEQLMREDLGLKKLH